MVEGLTSTEPFRATVETPLSMVTRVAWFVAHVRVYVSTPGVLGFRVASKLTYFRNLVDGNRNGSGDRGRSARAGGGQRVGRGLGGAYDSSACRDIQRTRYIGDGDLGSIGRRPFEDGFVVRSDGARVGGEAQDSRRCRAAPYTDGNLAGQRSAAPRSGQRVPSGGSGKRYVFRVGGGSSRRIAWRRPCWSRCR